LPTAQIQIQNIGLFESLFLGSVVLNTTCPKPLSLPEGILLPASEYNQHENFNFTHDDAKNTKEIFNVRKT